jgi:hypothetical protein
MSQFQPTAAPSEGEKMINQFNSFMDSLATAREQRSQALAARLSEERRNRQTYQQQIAFAIARFSPATLLTLSFSALAGSSAALSDNFLAQANEYQKAYGKFILEKTGVNPGGGMIMIRQVIGEEKPKPIDPGELPQFHYASAPLQSSLTAAAVDMGILALFVMIFCVGAYVTFLTYDVR